MEKNKKNIFNQNDFKKDYECLGDGKIYEINYSANTINNNEIIIGPTRSGKTTSIVEPRLLHTNNASVVVPLSKRELADKYIKLFKQRGYKTEILDFTNSSQSTVSFDVLNYIQNELDISELATILIPEDMESKDTFWVYAARDTFDALCRLSIENSKAKNETPTIKELYNIYKSLKINEQQTSLDYLFEKLNEKYPDNVTSIKWDGFKNLPMTTMGCVKGFLNIAITKICNEFVLRSINNKKSIDFQKIASEKTALFIVTSPVNKSIQDYVTVFYSFLIKGLFEMAEKKDDKKLHVPVHIIFDDFATGSIIEKFDEYISIFCAMGISSTILLQSETQLYSIYGDYKAKTIINNCDTYVYLGGNDETTCKNISERADLFLKDVYEKPYEDIYIFRRGEKFLKAKRYKTFEDEVYRKNIKAD